MPWLHRSSSVELQPPALDSRRWDLATMYGELRTSARPSKRQNPWFSAIVLQVRHSSVLTCMDGEAFLEATLHQDSRTGEMTFLLSVLFFEYRCRLLPLALQTRDFQGRDLNELNACGSALEKEPSVSSWDLARHRHPGMPSHLLPSWPFRVSPARRDRHLRKKCCRTRSVLQIPPPEDPPNRRPQRRRRIAP